MPESLLKILVIDDEPVMRALFESLLEELNHEVICAENSEIGISLVKESFVSQKNFDLIFVDLITDGGLTGIETFKQIMQLSPDVYAVACSGYLQNMTPEDLFRHGFKGFLNKPFDFEELEEKQDTH